MKTLVLTGYDNRMQELGDLTSPRMLAWASKFGFDFKCYRHFESNEVPAWRKVLGTLFAFDDGYEQVFWIDADIVITNMHRFPLPFDVVGKDFNDGLHVSQDWGEDSTRDEDFSTCCFLALPSSRFMFEYAVEVMKKTPNIPYWEQAALRECYKKVPRSKDTVAVYNPRELNAVPLEIDSTVREPWQPGDWAAHLTMVNLPERVRLAKLFLAKEYK